MLEHTRYDDAMTTTTAHEVHSLTFRVASQRVLDEVAGLAADHGLLLTLNVEVKRHLLWESRKNRVTLVAATSEQSRVLAILARHLGVA